MSKFGVTSLADYLIDCPINELNEFLMYCKFKEICGSGKIEVIKIALESEIKKWERRLKECQEKLKDYETYYTNWYQKYYQEYSLEYEDIKKKITYLENFLKLKDNKLKDFQSVLECNGIIEELKVLLPRYEQIIKEGNSIPTPKHIQQNKEDTQIKLSICKRKIKELNTQLKIVTKAYNNLTKSMKKNQIEIYAKES